MVSAIHIITSKAVKGGVLLKVAGGFIIQLPLAIMAQQPAKKTK
jgi:hypothetical protein